MSDEDLRGDQLRAAHEALTAAGFEATDWVSPNGRVVVSAAVRDGRFVIKDYSTTADPKKEPVDLTQLQRYAAFLRASR